MPCFNHLQVNFEKLKAFGFVLTDQGQYQYNASILNSTLVIYVVVNREGQLSSQIIDREINEIYTLHLLASAVGRYVGTIRAAYENLLTRIAEQCFEKHVFKGEYAQSVIQYVREKYQDELEFLWPKFPENAILRRQDTAKWYAAILVVTPEKIGLSGQEKIEILALRMETVDLKTVIDHKQYFPGYHMNKNHWVTICLDGSLDFEEIMTRIDQSYTLAVK